MRLRYFELQNRLKRNKITTQNPNLQQISHFNSGLFLVLEERKNAIGRSINLKQKTMTDLTQLLISSSLCYLCVIHSFITLTFSI